MGTPLFNKPHARRITARFEAVRSWTIRHVGPASRAARDLERLKYRSRSPTLSHWLSPAMFGHALAAVGAMAVRRWKARRALEQNDNSTQEIRL